jgi:hypothetical protein
MPIGQLDLRRCRQPDCPARGGDQTATETLRRNGKPCARARTRNNEGRRCLRATRRRLLSGNTSRMRGINSAPFICLSLLGARQAGEPAGMGAGDECHRLGGTGSGAVLFQSFPQEVVDAFAEVTGGQRVRVRMPKTVNGYAWFDDQQRAFLVERIANPEGPECVKRGSFSSSTRGSAI